MRNLTAAMLTFFTWIPLCGQAPGKGIDSSHNAKQQAQFAASKPQTDQRGTKESPLIIETHDRPKTDDEAAEEKANKANTDFLNRWTLRFAGAVAGFTGLLVVFTLLLVVVGWRGVNAAKATLKAIEGQGKLMQAQFDQWVDLRNWKVNRSDDTLFAVVDLANPTAFPITITDGYIAVHMAGGKVGRTNLDGIVLSPSNPTPIRFDILDLSPWNEGQARSGYAELTWTISHSHRITGKDIIHPFAGRLYFNNLVRGEWEANFIQLSPGGAAQQPSQG